MSEKPKVVYGFFGNTGDGNEHYWHLGVYLTEVEAYEENKDMLNSPVYWIGEIVVH